MVAFTCCYLSIHQERIITSISKLKTPSLQNELAVIPIPEQLGLHGGNRNSNFVLRNQWTVLADLRYFPTLMLFTGLDWVNSKNNVRELR